MSREGDRMGLVSTFVVIGCSFSTGVFYSMFVNSKFKEKNHLHCMILNIVCIGINLLCR